MEHLSISIWLLFLIFAGFFIGVNANIDLNSPLPSMCGSYYTYLIDNFWFFVFQLHLGKQNAQLVHASRSHGKVKTFEKY